MDTEKQTDTPPQPDPEGQTAQLEKFLNAVPPWAQQLLLTGIQTLERSTRHSGIMTAILLGVIILTLGSLAGYALHLDRIDTAEKIVIALVSFLGGAAMFSGPPKK